MRSDRKVPRIDYGKYRGGRAAGRREAVAVLGDSLRELGCVRVQGHAGEVLSPAEALSPGEPAGFVASGDAVPPAPVGGLLAEVAHGLLDGLADYFGLPAGALAHLGDSSLRPVIDEVATSGEPAAGRELVPVPGLLLLLPDVPAGLAVRRADGDWFEAAAHPGELLVVAGEAVARLTGGRVPAAGVRWPPSGVAGWLLPAASEAELAPLPPFAES